MKAGADANSDDNLRRLLDEQERRARVINEGDDAREMTRKLLRGQDRILQSTVWTTANPLFLAEPKTWFYLIVSERGQAVAVINGSLGHFPQRHLTHQISMMVMTMAATCALAEAGQITIFQAWTVSEPLVRVLVEQMTYLHAKRIADQQGLNSREATQFMAESRGDDTAEGKLEAAARRIRGKRTRDDSPRRHDDQDHNNIRRFGKKR